MSRCYIQGAASISAQNNFAEDDFMTEVVAHTSNMAKAIPANYKAFISPAASRRMATGVKMGVAAAKMALQEANVTLPDAIVTGTGMGCIEDSEKFLKNMIDNDEEYLTPTSFIQSTHNTVGAQIALGLECKAYNVTYVHDAISFESSLIDAQLLLEEGEASTVLVGGVDELGTLFIEQVALMEKRNSGGITVPFGEGAHFFTMSSEKSDTTWAELQDVITFSVASPAQVVERLHAFLAKNKQNIGEIDAFVVGINGDEYDGYYQKLKAEFVVDTPCISYKHLSGEFYTASAFGFWGALRCLKKQKIPLAMLEDGIERSQYRTILLYNQYKGRQHSFILITTC